MKISIAVLIFSMLFGLTNSFKECYSSCSRWGYRVNDIKIKGIPRWEVRLVEKSRDTDALARFSFHLWWPSWEFSGDYIANTTEGLLQQHYKGNVS